MIHMSGINIAETQWTQALSSLSKFSIFAQKYRLNSNINISISENQKIGQKSRRGSFRWTTWWNSSQGWPWGTMRHFFSFNTNTNFGHDDWQANEWGHSPAGNQYWQQAPTLVCHNYSIFVWIQTNTNTSTNIHITVSQLSDIHLNTNTFISIQSNTSANISVS